MRKDDGSLSLGGEVTPLMEVLLRRRSVRKYTPGAATEEQVAYVMACVQAFIGRVGFAAPRLRVVDGEERRAVVDAATKGLVGKVNPWLPFTRAEHLILCGAVYGDDRASRERAIKEAAMAMQVAILAATELGLGTCWMAGINHERVELAHPMPDGAKLVAISTLGLPPARRGLSWDALAYHTVSKRRKPLDALRMPERWRTER
jgi:nitroreductase